MYSIRTFADILGERIVSFNRAFRMSFSGSFQGIPLNLASLFTGDTVRVQVSDDVGLTHGTGPLISR